MINRLFLSMMMLVMIITVYGQQCLSGAELELLLREKEYSRADACLRARLDSFFSSRQFDSLASYAAYVGQVEGGLNNTESAVKRMRLFLERVRNVGPSARALASVYMGAASYYASVGKYLQAYSICEKAYLSAKRGNATAEYLATLSSNMGTYAYRGGNIALAETHHRKAVATSLHSKTPDYNSLYTAANNMGAQMWFAAKYDSALYYYEIALSAIDHLEKTPLNRYYRPGMLQNNLSAIYGIKGEAKKAIAAMETSIEAVRTYLSIPESIPKRENSQNFLYEAIDNLAGIYKELGDYSQAQRLLLYSYEQKATLRKTDPAPVYKSEILLGQLYLAMKDHKRSLHYLSRGLDSISNLEDDYLFWQADACHSLAMLYQDQHQPVRAAFYYKRSDSLYTASLKGEYDDVYLGFLRTASQFYAENGNLPQGLAMAQKGLRYVSRIQGRETLLAFSELNNLAEVYLRGGQYRRALQVSKQALAVVNKRIRESSSSLDSIRMELQKPNAILVKVKAEYQLLKIRNKETLKGLLQELDEAEALLERRKSILHDVKDIGLVTESQGEVSTFLKKLTMELYETTHDPAYIDRLMSVQESGIYSRIRARLDKSTSVRFAHVPSQIQQKEKELRASIISTLDKRGPGTLDEYFAAQQNWQQFQQALKTDYPDYYKMRYGAVATSLSEVQRSISGNTTIIRYFFVDKDLFAVVLGATQKQLVALNAQELEGLIDVVSDFAAPFQRTSEALYRLHQLLWAPLQPKLHGSKLIIIPDGILFNLNFEVLTPNKISRREEMGASCLLSRYTIAYHYSLALAGQGQHPSNFVGNFVAFAPGFLDKEKQRYLASVKDPLQVDHQYVALLPQPFTVDFASKARSIVGGEAYINEASTAVSFRNFAGRHRIIHVGTHAESNNLSPEYSRLIFAKDTSSGPNSIFLPELYNCDLRSELTVLTACESGKPGYQDGEGMISLTHAFNYAGSASILTGLWKIDEKVSTLLLDAFYTNLMKGMAKDEALRKAKLQYLASSRGRPLSPPYWAGLVLVGDTSPITMVAGSHLIPWWPIAFAVLLGACCIIWFGSIKNRASPPQTAR